MPAVDFGRFMELLKRLGTHVAVVCQSLDFQHTPIGSKVNLMQGRQVFEAAARSEVIGFVDRGIGPQAPCLAVLGAVRVG